MSKENLSIYEQLMQPNSGIVDILMGEGGEAMLNQEILKMRDEIGQEQFNEYALQFFKDTNINYKTFFGIPEQKIEGIKLTEVTEETQTDHLNNKEQQQGRNQQNNQVVLLQVGNEDQEQYTNNSQQVDNQFEEIEKEDLGQGKFRVKYKNGDLYEGQMEAGMKEGWGIYHYASGQRYEGCFIDDEINSYGRYYFLSGAEYEGDWSSGMKHGIGILNFANKDSYQGAFCRDDLHGKGIYKYHNGDIFEGIFKNGKRHGEGLFEGTDGRYQKGVWVDDKFQV